MNPNHQKKKERLEGEVRLQHFLIIVFVLIAIAIMFYAVSDAVIQSI
jgi:hypothetical protein